MLIARSWLLLLLWIFVCLCPIVCRCVGWCALCAFCVCVRNAFDCVSTRSSCFTHVNGYCCCCCRFCWGSSHKCWFRRDRCNVGGFFCYCVEILCLRYCRCCVRSCCSADSGSYALTNRRMPSAWIPMSVAHACHVGLSVTFYLCVVRGCRNVSRERNNQIVYFNQNLCKSVRSARNSTRWRHFSEGVRACNNNIRRLDANLVE